MEYEPIKVTGHFLHDKELHLGPRTLIEAEENRKKGGVLTMAPKSGYLVITPFKLNGREYDKDTTIGEIRHKQLRYSYNYRFRETILVNRGWVPKNKKNALSRSEGQIEGDIQITGIVRKHENRPQFMPKMKDDKLFLYR